MELQSIDGSKLLVLMIAGAIIAAAGLYLMLRPKPEDAAKIEIFGLKFESSSAGLLVFVIGAAFLAVPLFAPERPASLATEVFPDTEAEAPSMVPDSGENGTGQTGVVIAGRTPAAPTPVVASRGEEEPNDTLSSAELLVPGQTLSGYTNLNVDWIKLDVSSANSPVEVRLRKSSGARGFIVTLFNGREQEVGRTEVEDSTQFVELDPSSFSTYYLLLRSITGGRVYYEVVATEVGSD